MSALLAAPDFRLTAQLLCCLRQDNPERKAAQLEDWSPADWQAVVTHAQRNGLAPLLAWRMKELAGKVQIPAETQQALEAGLRQAALSNLRLYHNLKLVLQTLAQEQIPVIVLKGAYLAEHVYPNLAARPMVDLDLLVPQDELLRAYDTLRALGYQPSLLFNPRREVKNMHHLPLLTSGGDASANIEVHWTLIPPYLPQVIDLAGIWQRAVPATLSGQATRVLCPDDLLLHLCLHMSHHQYKFGVRTLFDLGEVLARLQPALDWEAILLGAQQAHARNSLFLGLHLAHELLNAPVPEQVLAALRPTDFSPELEELAIRRLFGLANPVPVHPFLAGLRGERPRQARLQPFLDSVFWRQDYMARRYGVPAASWRIYLYYPVRWAELLWTYGAQVMRMLLHRPDVEAAIRRENRLDDWIVSGE